MDRYTIGEDAGQLEQGLQGRVGIVRVDAPYTGRYTYTPDDGMMELPKELQRIAMKRQGVSLEGLMLYETPTQQPGVMWITDALKEGEYDPTKTFPLLIGPEGRWRLTGTQRDTEITLVGKGEYIELHTTGQPIITFRTTDSSGYIGSYEHKTDKKGRIILPNKMVQAAKERQGVTEKRDLKFFEYSDREGRICLADEIPDGVDTSKTYEVKVDNTGRFMTNTPSSFEAGREVRIQGQGGYILLTAPGLKTDSPGER